MKKKTLKLFLMWIACFGAAPAGAVTPLSQYLDLVAGEGEAGSRDGVFTSAMFNHPSSAAFSQDGKNLFVADRDNNLIRTVDLDQKNAVSTLAGGGEKGEKDGGFEAAAFDVPALVLSLPHNQLAVYDDGSKRLRLLDLSQKQVTTLSGGDPKDPSAPLVLPGVAQMAFDPQTNSIYFTQPDLGELKRLNLSTRQVSTVFSGDARVPNPSALCFFKGQLCVADQNLPTVYQVDSAAAILPVSFTPTPVEAAANSLPAVSGAALTEIAQGQHIAAMAESDGILYAFQTADIPWVRLTAGPGMPVGEIKFMSLWGPFLEPKSQELQNLLNFADSTIRPCLLPFPGEPRKFLWVSPGLNQIFAVRDYAFYEFKSSKYETYNGNPNGLTDFSYPESKPPHTFRVLMLGDSRVFYESEASKKWPWGFHRMDTTPKKLEADLNLEASLDDVPTHFQVLTYARYRWAGALPLWPYFFGVDPAKRFDVDAVILLMPNDLDLSDWFTVPYLKEGIPNLGVDDKEYLLKPMEEKLSGQPLVKDFYERCLAHHWMSKDKGDVPALSTLSTDPKVWSDLVEMVGKPLGLYQDQLKALAGKEGHSVPFYVFFVPVGSSGAPVPVESYRKLYTDICQKEGIDLEDLTDPWTALKISAYPVGEFWGMHHFDENGHTLLSYLIAHTLIQRRLIPFDAQVNSPVSPTPAP